MTNPVNRSITFVYVLAYERLRRPWAVSRITTSSGSWSILGRRADLWPVEWTRLAVRRVLR